MIKFFSGLSLGFFGFGLSTLLPTYTSNSKPLQLVQVHIISRHGARTPMRSKNHPPNFKQWPIQCHSIDTTYPDTVIVTQTQSVPYDEHKKNLLDGTSEKFTNTCGFEQLTTVGMSQMEKFGKLLRKRYIDSLGFLNDEFDGESISIRSTDMSRTILTARYIMEGVYPKEKRKNEPITINVNPILEESMFPRSSCKKFSILRNYQLSKLSDTKNNSKMILSKVEGDPSEIKYWNSRSSSGAVNDLNSMIDHDLPLPQGLSHMDYEVLVEHSGKLYQGINSTDEINRVGIGRFIKELIGNMESAVKKSRTEPSISPPNPKFFLYSGHDSTLGPLLSALEVFDGRHPRMGSAVILELWKNTENKFFFEMKYFVPKEGEKSLKLPSCNTNMCPLDNLLDKSKNLIPFDYTKECHEEVIIS